MNDDAMESVIGIGNALEYNTPTTASDFTERSKSKNKEKESWT